MPRSSGEKKTVEPSMKVYVQRHLDKDLSVLCSSLTFVSLLISEECNLEFRASDELFLDRCARMLCGFTRFEKFFSYGIVHLGCVEPVSSSYHTRCYQKRAGQFQQTDRIHDKRRSRTGRSSKVQKGRAFHTRERRVLDKCELRGAREVGNIDSCCTLGKTR